MRPTARVLIVERGLVLAVDHHGDPSRAGLPGGGLEPGEQPAQAALRELEEETGLVAVELRPVVLVEETRRLTAVFEAVACGRLRGSHEGAVRWAAPEELVSNRHGRFHRDVFEAAGLGL